jgi:hypothetical protein
LGELFHLRFQMCLYRRGNFDVSACDGDFHYFIVSLMPDNLIFKDLQYCKVYECYLFIKNNDNIPWRL